MNLRARFKGSIPLQIGALTVVRIVVNTLNRMSYPFIAVFAAGMSVNLADISLALAAGMGTSALGPFLAPLADRRGRKFGMLLGLAIFVMGCALAGFWPSYITFLLAMVLGNLGNNILVPAIQAYIGDVVAYRRRGLAISAVETSWALSFVLTIPLVGRLLGMTAWHVIFIVLFGAGLLTMALVALLIPRDHPAGDGPHFAAGFRLVLRSRTALLGLALGLTFVGGNELINVVFGVWMQDSFQFQVSSLGLTAMLLGAAELSGEGLGAVLIDRLGKERSVALGLIICLLDALALPWLGHTQVGALIWLFVFYLAFEFAIIASTSLMSEVLPAARATLLAIFIAAVSLGRALGDVVAPHAYQYGFAANVAISAVLNLLGLLALSRMRLTPTPAPAADSAE